MKYINVLKSGVVLLLFLATGQLSAATSASAGSGGVGAAFSKDTVSLGLIIGSGSFNNNNYFILGGSVGYYVIKGLEVGIDLEHWFSANPSITKVSPQIRYVFTQPKVVKPYIGTFVRRTFFEGSTIDDQNSYGYRAGAFFSTSNKVYIGGGVVYEKYDDCDQFTHCSDTYPEIIISFTF